MLSRYVLLELTSLSPAIKPTKESRKAFLDNMMTDSTFFVTSTTTASSNESLISQSQQVIDNQITNFQHASAVNESMLEDCEEDIFENEVEIANKINSIPAVVPFSYMKSDFSDELVDQDDSVDLGSKTSVICDEHVA